jgi:L,D-transpeptidase catalytic domain
MSSLGFYLTGEIYDGTHQHSMKLDGLTPDGGPNGMANSLARPRAIVVHEASYVNDDVTTKQGRSNGCPALDPSIEVSVVDRIHDGSLMYIATSSMAAPVGRATCGDSVCDGLETEASCALDCADAPPIEEPPVDADESTGCRASGNGSLVLALALLGLVRRRRRE